MTTYFIYSITNKANGFTYIGISIDYHKRLRAHRWKLINGSHPAKEMQSDFNLYGIESWEF
jgi:predicted GIY-YIG superfamily endonuclease